jgi:hypothetical protein
MMKITSDSHLDHGLTEKHLAWIQKCFSVDDGFFIKTVTLPPELGTLSCALHGPIMGDDPIQDAECSLEVRGDRPGPSRMCKRRPRETSMITVIAGPHEGEPCVLYTAFGGPSTPREPFDPSLDQVDLVESTAFWAVHALSKEDT